MMYKILLVDDQPLVSSSIKRMFEFRHEPFETFEAGSGREALQILRTQAIDLAIVDHDMPGMTGTELLAEIHKLYPEIIRYMLTGQGTLDIAIQAINTGAISRFFTKPCLVEDLVASMHQSLGHKDLMSMSKKLLDTAKKQHNELRRLEKEYPGIANVDFDEEGFIRIEHDDISVEELIGGLRSKSNKTQDIKTRSLRGSIAKNISNGDEFC